jgi:hypothetical protein
VKCAGHVRADSWFLKGWDGMKETFDQDRKGLSRVSGGRWCSESADVRNSTETPSLLPPSQSSGVRERNTLGVLLTKAKVFLIDRTKVNSSNTSRSRALT